MESPPVLPVNSVTSQATVETATPICTPGSSNICLSGPERFSGDSEMCHQTHFSPNVNFEFRVSPFPTDMCDYR